VSQQRYTPEFKDEAVRQVTEKGHSVQEVAARLGVSSMLIASPRELAGCDVTAERRRIRQSR